MNGKARRQKTPGIPTAFISAALDTMPGAFRRPGKPPGSPEKGGQPEYYRLFCGFGLSDEQYDAMAANAFVK